VPYISNAEYDERALAAQFISFSVVPHKHAMMTQRERSGRESCR
jgi:hypothetical protein